MVSALLGHLTKRVHCAPHACSYVVLVDIIEIIFLAVSAIINMAALNIYTLTNMKSLNFVEKLTSPLAEEMLERSL